MKIKDLYDIAKFRLQIEAKKKGLKVFLLSPRELAYFISAAQMDVQKKLKVIQSYSEITLVAGVNTYSLPSKFGIYRAATINYAPLRYTPYTTIVELPYESGLPMYLNVYAVGDERKVIVYPTPSETGTMFIHYYVDPGYFKASLLTFAASGNPYV